jgi:hypothetical protein
LRELTWLAAPRALAGVHGGVGPEEQLGRRIERSNQHDAGGSADRQRHKITYAKTPAFGVL